MPRQHAIHHQPTLADLQVRVDAWISQFEEGYWPPLAMLARLTEEVGELAREINHSHGHKPKKASEPAGDIALEVADIVFVLLCLCNSLQIDLGNAFERVMHKYEHRDGERWTRRGETPVTSSKPLRRAPRKGPGPRPKRTTSRPPARRRTPRRKPA